MKYWRERIKSDKGPVSLFYASEIGILFRITGPLSLPGEGDADAFPVCLCPALAGNLDSLFLVFLFFSFESLSLLVDLRKRLTVQCISVPVIYRYIDTRRWRFWW